jgi:SAM-dependent methyltransferase
VTDPYDDELLEDPEPFSIEDEKFDQIYPAKIRRLSSLHWTPVAVAAEAAQMLETTPGMRVLDVGCGPGKFCLVAASLVDACFIGIEQRSELVTAAREAASSLRLDNVEFRHANVMDVAFEEYEAFYVFNPFEENMFQGYKIDASVPLSPTLFKRYTSHVAAQLGAKPIGTHVVTYAGYGDEIPSCYGCESALFDNDLKLWVKHREYDADIEKLNLGVSRSYRGCAGWAGPRRAQGNGTSAPLEPPPRRDGTR